MNDRLQELIKVVMEHYRHPPTLNDRLWAICKGDPGCSALFFEVYGVVPAVWSWIFRTAVAAEMVARQPDFVVGEIAHFTGFEDMILFERCFVRLLGQTPQLFQTRAKALNEAAGGAKAPHAFTLADLAGEVIERALEKAAPPRDVMTSCHPRQLFALDQVDDRIEHL